MSKRKQKRHYVTRGILFLIFVAATWTAIYRPYWTHYFSGLAHLPYLTLCLLPLLLVWKQGRGFLEKPIHYSEPETSKLSFWAWQRHWWGALLGLWFLWMVHCLAWVVNAPDWVVSKIPPMEVFLAPYGQAFSPLELGYPWALYMLLTFSYVWFAGVLKKPIPESLSEPLFKGRLDPVVKGMNGWLAINSTQYCIVLTLVTFVLLNLKVLTDVFELPSQLDIGIWGLMFISIFLMLLRRLAWPLWARWGYRRQYGLLFWSFLMAVVMIVTLPLLGALCLSVLPSMRHAISVDLVVTLKLDRWADPGLRFETLVFGWWVLWAPLMASYLAYISRGQRLGLIVVMALATPVLLSLLPIHFIFLEMLKQWKAFAPWELLILSSIVCAILVWILKGQMTNQRLVQGWMTIPRGKILKVQGLGKILMGWILLIVNLLLIQAVGGWYFLQIQMLGPALILIACMVLLNITLLKSVWEYRG